MCAAGVDHFVGISLATFARGRHCYTGQATRYALPAYSEAEDSIG